MSKESRKLATQVISSIFFKNAQLKAKRSVRNGQALAQLLIQVYAKSQTLDGKSGYAMFREELDTLWRMVRAYKHGSYRQVPWRSILTIVAALVYFVNPLDFIPDFLPLVGFTDDVALVLWIYRSTKVDIDNFRAWEAEQVTPLADQ